MKRPILIATAALLTCTPVPAVALQIFASNEKDNTVTVIDGKTLEVIKTIPTARRPRGIIASPDGKEVYVAAGDGDIMDVIDTSKLEITRQLESGPDPELMAVSSRGAGLALSGPAPLRRRGRSRGVRP
jgi:YVTN family beta-propeller protein